MNKLVFLEPDDLNEIPFKTSKVIAEHGQVQHHTVTRLIQTYESDLEDFGSSDLKSNPWNPKVGYRTQKVITSTNSMPHYLSST